MRRNRRPQGRWGCVLTSRGRSVAAASAQPGVAVDERRDGVSLGQPSPPARLRAGALHRHTACTWMLEVGVEAWTKAATQTAGG